MKKLKEQLQETVLVVATAIPPLDAVGDWGGSTSGGGLKQEVAPAARNHLSGFWEALGPHRMVVTVLPA